MSVPTKPGQSPNQSGTGSILVIVLSVLGCMAFLCCGGLALLGSLFYSRLDSATAQRVQATIQNNPTPAFSPARQMEWIAMAQLTPVYTAALDTVVGNPEVLEKLGEPIQTPADPEALFRRAQKGEWTGEEESFEFDIAGPKGTAVVHVMAGAPGMLPGAPGMMPGENGSMWPKSIRVTLQDGTEILVPYRREKPEP
jgi:hypothetical protein